MSWDLSVECETCGSDRLWVNYTHNMNAAIRGAGIMEWPYVDGMAADDLADRIDHAVAEINARRGEFERLNAPNGWGSIGTLIPVLETCRDGLAGLGSRPVRMSS